MAGVWEAECTYLEVGEEKFFPELAQGRFDVARLLLDA
jgi:hypothetical protein